jgi:hypothetical protein
MKNINRASRLNYSTRHRRRASTPKKTEKKDSWKIIETKKYCEVPKVPKLVENEIHLIIKISSKKLKMAFFKNNKSKENRFFCLYF